MDESQRFRRWFEEATGNQPYAYQRSLAEATHPPSVVAVPTGSGKTQALLGAWLFQRRRGAAPRRLVYALPMRSLVEQTAAVAREMRERLELSPDALPIHVLMGGEEPAKDDWRRQPERAQILIGTIDMLLSRALNRGYAESRFAWPVSFGLLNDAATSPGSCGPGSVEASPKGGAEQVERRHRGLVAPAPLKQRRHLHRPGHRRGHRGLVAPAPLKQVPDVAPESSSHRHRGLVAPAPLKRAVAWPDGSCCAGHRGLVAPAPLKRRRGGDTVGRRLVTGVLWPRLR